MALLLFRFFGGRERRARARCFAAARACRQKKWPLAAQFFREAYEIADKLKEPLRSKTQCQIEAQWAPLLYRQGELPAAEDMFRRSSRTGAKHYAPGSEMLIINSVFLGDICVDEERYAEAEIHYRQALEADESSDNLAGMIREVEALSHILIRQDRPLEALPLVERAVELETRSARGFAQKQGMDPDRYRLTPTSLPAFHFCRGEFDEAARLYGSQIANWKSRANRPGNVDLGYLNVQLALSEWRLGHLDEAIRAYDEAAKEFEREWCEGHPKALAARKAKSAVVEARDGARGESAL
jgi:tetratricopeptide (TPR) repeat protein